MPVAAQQDYRRNERIRVPTVRLIDESGANIGVIATVEALAMAHDRGLDLVEVSPLANPPVAKIVNYAKLKYEEEKERRKSKSKQKKVEIKGIRLSLRIGEHDRDVRLKQAERFLSQDDKVKLEVILRGRERQHTDLAKEIVNKFVSALQERLAVTVEQKMSIQGGRLSLVVAKAK